MANGISSYKGVWQKQSEAAPEVAPTFIALADPVSTAMDLDIAEPLKPTEEPPNQIPKAFLDHRYRLLVLNEHRHKLGQQLLEAGHRNPYLLAWAACTSFGKSYRPWAHARLFAMGCYLGVDMPPDILRQLRHPWRFWRYRRSMIWLWNLLQMLAKKNQQKPLKGTAFRWLYVCPPLGMLLFERQLQGLLSLAAGEVPSKQQRRWFARREAQGQ